MHALGSGDVATGRDDASFAAADDHGPVAKGWIVALFDRRIEGIAIHMRDRQTTAFGMGEEARRPAGGAAIPRAVRNRQTITAKSRGAHGISGVGERRSLALAMVAGS